MKILQEKIRQEGFIKGHDILKVDNFLNHQLDIDFLNQIGQEFKARFTGQEITKILTIEASGIAIAAITAQYFHVPVLFAKKTESRNLEEDTYNSEIYSYTREKSYKIRVSKKYLNQNDKILIIDDFLAQGKAVMGLYDIIKQAQAKLVGVGIVIEKGFQDGGQILRAQDIWVESLAIIKNMEVGQIVFG